MNPFPDRGREHSRRENKMIQIKWLAPAGALLLLAGCATQPSAPVQDRSLGTAITGTLERTDRGDFYTVVRGDTLYGISFRVGLDYRELAAFNGISEPYIIYPGQRVRIPGGPEPTAAPARIASAPQAATTAPIRERSFNAEPLPDEQASGAATTRGLSDAPVSGQLIAEPATSTSGARVGLSVPPIPAGTTVATTTRPPLGAAGGTPSIQAPVSMTQPALPAVAGAWRWPTEGRVISTFAAGDPGRKGVDISGTVGQSIVAAGDGVVVYSGEGMIGYGQLIIIKHTSALLSAYGHNRQRTVKEGDRVKGGQQIAEMGSTNGAQPALHFEIRQGGKPVDPLRYLPKR